MVRKLKLGIDIKTLLIKSIAVGLLFAGISWLTYAILGSLESFGFGWMQYVLLMLASISMILAMKFRKGTENLLEAIVSMGLMYGVWGLIGYMIRVSPLSPYVAQTGLFEIIMFITLFFTAEGISQRVLKQMKLL